MDEIELRRVAGKQGMPLGTIEKDYVLTILLSKLGEKEFSRELVFKGGTAIKKTYFPEARFSEDLDFTCTTTPVPKKLEGFLEKEISSTKIECIQFNKATKASEGKKSAKIKLSYFDLAGHSQSINFDLSMREKVILPVIEREINNTYNQPKTKITTMDLTEIMAEKIRALAVRGLPRDLYDVWFLSKKNTKIDYLLAEQKLAYYNTVLEINKIEKRIKEIERTWKRDLERLIRPLPAYSEIAAETIKTFQKAGK